MAAGLQGRPSDGQNPVAYWRLLLREALADRLLSPSDAPATNSHANLTVMPGLVDAHNYLALTYKPEPERNICGLVNGWRIR